MAQKFFTLLLCLAGACLTKIILDYFEIFKNLEIDWFTALACGVAAYLIFYKLSQR